MRSDGNILCGSRIGEFPNELPVNSEAFIKAFNDAILDIYDGDAEKVKEKMKLEKEEKVKLNKLSKSKIKDENDDDDDDSDDSEETEELTDADLEQADNLIEEINELIADMKKSDKLKCGKHFKEILGTNNYKTIENPKLLIQALEFVKSL